MKQVDTLAAEFPAKTFASPVLLLQALCDALLLCQELFVLVLRRHAARRASTEEREIGSSQGAALTDRECRLEAVCQPPHFCRILCMTAPSEGASWTRSPKLL